MPSPDHVVLKAVGDLMLGDFPVRIGHGVRSTIERMGFDAFFAPAAPLFRDADLVFGNLETVLSDHGLDRSLLESFEFRGRPEEAAGLARHGFHLLSVANNHALQHGIPPFEETVRAVRDAGIDVLGLETGEGCNVVTRTVRGVELRFLSYSMRPERFVRGPIPYARAEGDAIVEHVRRARRGSDAPIVLSIHWGEEYLNEPGRWQIDLAHRLVDAGVSLLLGHHPHVLQGVEEYGGALIAYSLGNFVFDQWQRNPRETMVLRCELDAGGVRGWSWEPVYINDRHQPVPAAGADRERIDRAIRRYNAAVPEVAAGTGAYAGWTDEAYRERAEKAYFRFRMESYAYFLLHLHRYQPAMVASSVKRALLRRLGRG